MISESALRYWGIIEGGGDPITSQWFSVTSVYYPISVICLYLIMVATTGKNIKHTKFKNNFFISVYNMFQVCMSFYIVKEVYISSHSYSYICEPLHSTDSGNGRRMAEAVWYFYFLKYCDLFDTVFIILKGNRRQLSILHLFHHSTMILFMWMTIRHAPNGHCFVAVVLNSTVHVIMYSYYFLSSLGDWIKPYLWWKKYLTIIQIGQFIIMMMHVIIGLAVQCQYPQEGFYILTGYLIILIVLFSNFYQKNYNNKKVQ